MRMTAGGTASSLFSHATRLRVKRGAPEHRDLGAPTGSLALTLALTTASRPGIPAAAELARGPGPEDVECLHLTALQGHTVTKYQDQVQPTLR